MSSTIQHEKRATGTAKYTLPEVETIQGRNGGTLRKGAPTKPERFLRQLEKLGVTIIPPEPKEPQEPDPPRYDSPLANLIAETQELIPLSDGTGLQSVCPLCRSQGFPVVVIGERFWCLSESCRRGQVYIGEQERKIVQIEPVAGDADDWKGLRESFPRLFKFPPDHRIALLEATESLSDPWLWDATECPWWCDGALPAIEIPGHQPVEFRTDFGEREGDGAALEGLRRRQNCPSLPSSCPSEASQGEIGALGRGSGSAVGNCGASPSSGTSAVPSSADPGGRGGGRGVRFGVETASHTPEKILKPMSPREKECFEWLKTFLSDGPKLKETICEAGLSFRFLPKLIYEAKKRLPILVTDTGDGIRRKKVMWTLRTDV